MAVHSLPRQKAAAVLAEAAARLAAATFVVDAEGRCLAANAAGSELSGYTVEELCELAPGALNAFADEGVIHRVGVVRGLRHHGTTHLLRKDGSTVAIEFAAAPSWVGGKEVLLTICWPSCSAGRHPAPRPAEAGRR